MTTVLLNYLDGQRGISPPENLNDFEIEGKMPEGYEAGFDVRE